MKNKWFLKVLILIAILTFLAAFDGIISKVFAQTFYCKVGKNYNLDYPFVSIEMNVQAQTTFRIDVQLEADDGTSLTLRLIPGTSSDSYDSGTKVITHYIVADSDNSALYATGMNSFKRFTVGDLEINLPLWTTSYTYSTSNAGIRGINIEANDLIIDYIKFYEKGNTTAQSTEEFNTAYTTANFASSGWNNMQSSSGYIGTPYINNGALIVTYSQQGQTTYPYYGYYGSYYPQQGYYGSYYPQQQGYYGSYYPQQGYYGSYYPQQQGYYGSYYPQQGYYGSYYPQQQGYYGSYYPQQQGYYGSYPQQGNYYGGYPYGNTTGYFGGLMGGIGAYPGGPMAIPPMTALPPLGGLGAIPPLGALGGLGNVFLSLGGGLGLGGFNPFGLGGGLTGLGAFDPLSIGLFATGLGLGLPF